MKVFHLIFLTYVGAAPITFSGQDSRLSKRIMLIGKGDDITIDDNKDIGNGGIVNDECVAASDDQINDEQDNFDSGAENA